MPEDDKRYKGKKVINVLVTTNRGMEQKCKGNTMMGHGIGEESMVV